MSADDARAALRDLTDTQLRSALMCLWVKDPTTFWQAVKAAEQDRAQRDADADLGAVDGAPGHG